ncbi:acyltransferase domain-containing protein, partial [Streptomyces sp. NK08204]|uniref:acyltransferase domain-containing protein n=1 Tax=Streptomyces sp. NK08204 TaxID=2873260 RepID=UPI001CEC4000
ARRIPVDYASHSAHVDRIRTELLEVLADVAPRPSSVPFYSTVTATELDTTTLDAEYWYTNLRQTVRFDETVRALLAAGHRAFVEASPHPVLTAAVQETVEQQGDSEALVLASLRRDEGGPTRFLLSLAQAHVGGIRVDWSPLFAGTGARRVELPTYAFQRRRYWLEPAATMADVASAGLGTTEHPLLGAVVTPADADTLLLTGRLSLRTHPWLADHTVSGVTLLPGTGFVELALRAGDSAGCDRIEELTLEAPLVLPAQDAVQLQLVVGSPDAAGRRAVSVYARPDDAQDQPWTRHATGTLAVGTAAAPAGETAEPAAWPPAGAQAVGIEDLYERLAAAGLGYGPAFQGLEAVWRRGEEVFATVALPAEQRADAARFGVHPALLDAALHAVAAGPRTLEGATPQPSLPFVWSGVALHATGATALRVRLVPTGSGTLSLLVADESGRPVASVDALATRPISTEQLAAARDGSQDSLFRLHWTGLPTPPTPASADRWAVLDGGFALPTGADVPTYPDLAALAQAVAEGAALPEAVFVPVTADSGSSGMDAAALREALRRTVE